MRYPPGTNLPKLCLPTDPSSIQLNFARTYCNLDAIRWHHFCYTFCLPQDYSWLFQTRNIPHFNYFNWGWILFVDQNLTGLKSLLNPFGFQIILLFNSFLGGFILVKPTGSARRLAIWRSHSESSRRKGTSWLERSLVTGAACPGRCQTKKTSGRFGRSDVGVGVWHIKEDIGMIRSYSWAITSN